MKAAERSSVAREVPDADLAALLARVAAGDERAFAQLYDATIDRVFALARRITGDPSNAEDAVGDVYLQVWHQASTYRSERGTVMAWMTILCRSRSLDMLRRMSTAARRTQLLPDNSDVTDPAPSAPDLLEATERGSRLHAALAELTTDQRQLLALAYFRGHTHQELATLTGAPLGTVKTHLYRATQKLKQLMIDNDTQEHE